MADRYAVRESASGFGVWDTELADWVGPHDLAQDVARRRADLLNRAKGDPSPAYRTIDPPKPVILAAAGEQHLGALTAWSRERGQWWGWVTVESHGGWYPASVLHQAT